MTIYDQDLDAESRQFCAFVADIHVAPSSHGLWR